MNILFVTPYFHPYVGGIEKVVSALADSLSSHKMIDRVSIITTKSNFPHGFFKNLPSYQKINNIEIFRINFFFRNFPFIYHAYNAGLFSWELKKIVDNINPDVIHLCKTEWFLPNSYIVRKYYGKCKLVFYSSYHRKEIRLKHLPMIYFNRFIFNKVNYLHVPSNAVGEDMARVFNIPKSKIKVIPNPIIIKINKKSKKIGKPRIINILSIGRFEENKQQLDLIKALQQLPNSLKKTYHLTLVGTDGGQLEKIVSFIKKNNINNISIKENISDDLRNELFNNTDIYINMSKSEAFSISTAEAMLFGIPILSFNLGSIYETTKGKALYAEKGNWNDLTEKLSLLICNDELRNQFGERMQRISKEFWSIEKFTNEIIRLYKS